MITLKIIAPGQKPELKAMMLSYFQEIDPSKIAEQKSAITLDYPYLHTYWTDDDRRPYFILSNGERAGFVLVNNWTIYEAYQATKSIAEFYVLPKFRRQGIGKHIAHQLFDRYPEKWEIRQSQHNSSAIQFWRQTISEYTQGKFEEHQIDQDGSIIILQVFDPAAKSRKS